MQGSSRPLAADATAQAVTVFRRAGDLVVEAEDAEHEAAAARAEADRLVRCAGDVEGRNEL